VVWPTGPGSYRVELGPEERALLRELPIQLRDAMAANKDDPALRRLFPTAHPNDPGAEKEFRSLVGRELEESKAQSLETLAKTAGSTELSQEEMEAWLRALNDVRLWLGTLLDIKEDETAEEPEDSPHILYHVLTALQSLVIDALSGEM
jgi:Domain of unknown function (DUF2017)